MITLATMPPRTLVIGLDCAPPALVFDRYLSQLPNIESLMQQGCYGPLRSSEPPITVPAWTCMVTGRDPGELGLYGFRSRIRGSYDLKVATSENVKHKRVWDWLGEAGHKVAALFVPLTWPPPPVRGKLVSGFLAPHDGSAYTFPASYAQVLEERFGPHISDVADFRHGDAERIVSDLRVMAEQHFSIAEYVWETEKPSFMMMVELGTDRLHHALWHRMDPLHPAYEKDHPLELAAIDYYRLLDARIGRLMKLAGPSTNVLVVSDHGARSMQGGFAINEWLRREGWLHLHTEPTSPGPLKNEMIDWTRTRAWSTGGYYARVFLNVAGRDPQGIIPSGQYDATLQELRSDLERLSCPTGEPLPHRFVDPRRGYRSVQGFAPDLMLYLDGLNLRALGTVGGESLFPKEDDRGVDGCNHDWNGIFVMRGPDLPHRGKLEGMQIYDVGKTILGTMGVEPPDGLLGKDWSAK